ncbi:MAG: choice-of-anchor D domain-containing protein, partial [Chlorobiota bacterium]
VTGIGIAPVFELTVPTFGDKRVLTVTTLQAQLRNTNDTLDGIVKDIRLRNGANPHFALSNVPQLPIRVPAGGSLTFDVTFTPQIEGDLSEVIEAVIEGVIDPVAATTSGRGILPKIQAADVTFQPTPVGVVSTEVGSLIIRNTSQTAPLTIKSVSSPSTPSFWFQTPPVTPQVIAIGDSLVIPVQFRPTQPGLNTATVTIISDAAPGPNPTPDATTTVTLRGIGLALSISTPQDFGDVLLCETSVSRVITITNPGTQDESFRITAEGDTAAFTITASDTIIRPGGTVTVTVGYIPSPGQRTLTLVITSSALPQPYRITLTAVGITRAFGLAVDDANIDVGRTRPVTIRFATTPDAGSLVQRIQLQLTYRTSAIEIDDRQFQTLQNGWTWSLQHTPTGVILEGTSALGITSGSLEVQVPFTAYISSELIQSVVPTLLNASDYPCLVVQPRTGTIRIPYYCAQESRQVVLVGPTTFSIHHDGSNVVISVSIGEDIPYQLDVFSSAGMLVAHLAEGNRRGSYTITVGSDQLPSGAFFVRLWTPLQTTVQPILIAR